MIATAVDKKIIKKNTRIHEKLALPKLCIKINEMHRLKIYLHDMN
jgi:hypothetical protein